MPDVRPTDPLSKYVVFKREDWEAIRGEFQMMLAEDKALGVAEAFEVADTFVLRSSDVFGAQALFGYAHLIQTVLEVEALPSRFKLFTDDERKYLMDLVELVNETGLEWNRHPKKVPT